MRKRIDKWVGGFLVFLMVIMTLDVLWGVFTRYALGNQASWSEELARFLMIWIGILGAAFASGRKLHLSIDLLSIKLGADGKKLQTQIIHFFIIVFALCVLVIGGARLIYISEILGQTSPALQIPMTLVYAVLPLSGLLIVYYKIHDLFKNSSPS